MSFVRRWAFPLSAGVMARLAMWLSPKSFWGDEWFSFHAAELPRLMDTVRFSMSDVHPPLYYVLLRCFLQVFGGTELAARALSMIAGIAMFFTLVAIADRYLERFSARALAWIVALSPYWLQSANEVRSYALMAYCVTAAGTGFLRMVEAEETGSLKSSGTPENGRELVVPWITVYLFFSVTAVYVEHYAWFWLFASAGYFAYRAVLTRRFTRNLTTACAAAAFGLPALALVVRQARHGEQMFVASRVLEYWNPVWMLKKIGGIFWHFSAGYEFAMLTGDKIVQYAVSSPYFWACASAAACGFTCFVAGWIGFRRARPALWWAVLAVFAAPLVFLWLVYPIRLHARYLSFAAPWFMLAVAAGIGRLPRWVGKTILILLLTVSAAGVWKAVGSTTDRVHREDYRGMVSYVAEHAQSGDVVAGMQPQFDYYSNGGEGLSPIRRFASWQELTSEVTRGARRIWVLGIQNMHPEVSERILKPIDQSLLSLGYSRHREPIVFGGPEALTVLYVFERDLA